VGFIFTGTVQALKRATVPNIPLSSRTAVVRVAGVIRGSGALSHLAGRDITVQLGDRERVRPGQTATFYTEGWLFGESVAVRSLGHADVTHGAAAPVASTADPVQAKADRDLREHVADADLIVRGRVASVAQPALPAGVRLERSLRSIVAAQRTVSRRAMIMDATYDYEVWNQPIFSYEYQYFNPATMRAIRMGKAVYTQKPLTQTIYEARQLANAAQEKNFARSGFRDRHGF
jgi:hypothetical protein